MSTRKLLALATTLTMATILSGCSGTPLPLVGQDNPSTVQVSINPGQSFFPDQTDDNERGSPITLNQMENIPHLSDTTPKQQAEMLLFMPAMRDAAIKYGVEGGLAYSTALINNVLRMDAADLTKTYDFTRIVTYEPGGAMILPPVISSSTNTYQEADFGRTIRVANQTYDIVREAQFAPNTPLWFGYLYRPWHAAEKPPQSTLPRNDDERKAWIQYVDEGWNDGVQQGEMNFKLNMAKLNQEFVGMIRYRTLYDAGQVSAPVVQNQYLGTTGDGTTMRQGDRVEKILQEPELNVPNIGQPPIRPSN